MKKSEGISLISLIVTIVVIIILAGIAVYNGLTENIDKTASTMDYNEIFEVSEAVAQRALFNRLNEASYLLIGDSGEFKVKMEQKSGDGDKEEVIEVEKVFKSSDGWFLVDTEDAEKLNLEKVRRKYIVNYETSEVISLVPIIYEDTKYYAASDLKDALGGGSVVISSSRYDEEKGVNKPFVISGMIPVKRVNDRWVITNVDDEEWYDYASSDSEEGSGNLWANIMLLDEIEVEGMLNSEVRKASLSELEGKIVTKEGSMFVWIPRYSRGVIESKTRIVYSRLIDDYFKGGTNSVLDAFRDNGVELTGIWVSKYDAGYIEK